MASCPPKLVSEPARERESFKYGASLLNDITDSPSEGASPPGQNTPSDNPFDDAIKQQKASRDTVLASLAQLGLWRTGTDRALISLFDRNHQYIVAETTQKSSLAPGPIRSINDHGEFWLYPGTFPRQLSVCDRALMAQKNDPSAPEAELPLTLIPDLEADARLSKLPHPLSGCPARFYAAVPIRSPSGVDIGVYCVVDPQPRAAETWRDSDTQALREVSSNIMDYLQSKSVGDAYRRSVRMTRGIGSFVERESTMAGWRAGASSPAFHDDVTREGALNSEQQALQRFRGLSLQKTLPVHVPTQANTGSETTAVSSGDTGQANMTSASSKDPSTRESDANVKEKAMAKIFSRAANLIREGIEIEGVLFLDANLEASAVEGMLHNDSHSTPESSSSSDEASTQAPDEEERRCCGILGFATSTSSSINSDAVSDLHAGLPMKLLAALLRRYPTGKIFNFDEDGELLTSGSSEEDLSTSMFRQDDLVEGSPTVLSSKKERPWSRSSEGPSLSRVFPGARSVAFLPVWDPKRDRWLAGGFAYTMAPTRSFTIEGELSYLRAFGMLAMSETQRLEALLVNKAQSDVLGSLSHELRTPLHGVMLAAELLSDTQLDVFQGNLLRTLETCGRTLSETIDHLLYFTKVNQVAVHRKRERRARKKSIVGDPSATLAASTSMSEVRLDALVEEVMDSVFAGHVFRRNEADKVWQTSNRSGRMDIDDAQSPDTNELTGGQVDDTIKYEVPLGHESQVAIFLDIDPYVPYRFHVAAGALRRVVMNLFGNALKYTQHGTITVSLSQKPLSSNKQDSNKRVVRISVTDTGQGISPDFLRNDLFKPFSQENHLSHGTGLGLSLVKKIVASMGGKISIESKVNVGTTATITLPLSRSNDPDPSHQGEEKNEVDEEAKRLKGLRVRLIGFPSEEEIKSRTATGIPMSAMRTMCHRWLEMDVIHESSCRDVAPDLVLCNEMAMDDPVLTSEELVRSPVVVVCANAITAHKRSSERKSSEEQRVYEFVSQPIGPHKLARILHIAFRRWGDLQALSPLTPTKVDGESLDQQRDDSPKPSNGGIKRANAPNDSPAPSGPRTESIKRPGPPTRASPANTPTEVSKESSSPDGTKSFLLVDDNPINISVLCAYMKKLKSKYATAADGLEAVERFQESPDLFRCILMDISMPRMDGIEATKQIRAFERSKEREPVVILALTGLASASAQQDAYESGVDVFLSKPVKLKELSTILREKKLV
ncbi:hypothetical protein NW752_002714 [Fusarium irregulare]|uniref:histidine kinase n=1 Tax=Fusarium irregulare TaxID=2494466 RepID=A0A9W8Q0B7_9HYPO|nr:hypothetical protein NW766_000379 [Fusarium irregulare]KAJ4025246.1 hypothetical protein NW752_002714 [Fusarium irregulare]